MVAVPTATPVTIPVVEPTVATGVRLLSHVPPGEASLRVIVLPTPTVELPEIGGAALTVNVNVALLVPTVYEIVQTPAETPVTTPVVEPTVAIEVLLELH
jgi:hypothetical protein